MKKPEKSREGIVRQGTKKVAIWMPKAAPERRPTVWAKIPSSRVMAQNMKKRDGSMGWPVRK